MLFASRCGTEITIVRQIHQNRSAEGGELPYQVRDRRFVTDKSAKLFLSDIERAHSLPGSKSPISFAIFPIIPLNGNGMYSPKGTRKILSYRPFNCPSGEISMAEFKMPPLPGLANRSRNQGSSHEAREIL